jgi:hypothetical protein
MKDASMLFIRAMKSALRRAGFWIGEAYCVAGEKIGERIERVSDAIAEGSRPAERPSEWMSVPPSTAARANETARLPAVNGHKHLD